MFGILSNTDEQRDTAPYLKKINRSKFSNQLSLFDLRMTILMSSRKFNNKVYFKQFFNKCI